MRMIERKRQLRHVHMIINHMISREINTCDYASDYRVYGGCGDELIK